MIPENKEIMKAELMANNINLCTGCDFPRSHSRGFAVVWTKTIHYSPKGATRKTLYGFLHEIGHIVLKHGPTCKLRRYEKEFQAEKYARDSFRSFGIPLPREAVAIGNAYIKRMKRFGNNIKRGKRQ